MTEQPPKPPHRQLQMLWPESKLDQPPVPEVAGGYSLRQFREGEEHRYIALMNGAGFANWNRDLLVRVLPKVLPGGFFIIEHEETGALAATAMTQDKPIEGHPGGGELGWVAGDPAHKGKGLGMAVSAAATARLIEAGYRRIFLLTDDFRLPALSIYLRLGFEPRLFCEGMEERWRDVREKLRL